MIRRLLSSWGARAAVAGLFGVALINACSANGRDRGFTDGDGGAGGDPIFTTGSGMPSTSSGDATLAGGSTSSGGVGGGCASESKKAEAIPLDLMVMFDQSGSMSDSTGAGTKWNVCTTAFKQFLQDPASAGIGVGIQYFGLPEGGGMACPSMCQTDADCPGMCGPCFGAFPPFAPGVCFGGASAGDSCNPVDYSGAEVEIAPLPGVAQAIITSLGKHSPSTGTPTHPALSGAITHAQNWHAQNLDHTVVVVFITDGDPSGCNENLSDINQVAADGFANGILTFVIGVGSSLNALNGIAAAGGTMQAFLVDANANAGQAFLDALNAIRGTALSCSYKIPVPTNGVPDYNAVNVQYKPGNGGAPVIFPKVNDLQSCPQNGNAWYYDNNQAPTQIVMCPATCDLLKADAMGQIDIVLGCQTIVN